MFSKKKNAEHHPHIVKQSETRAIGQKIYSYVDNSLWHCSFQKEKEKKQTKKTLITQALSLTLKINKGKHQNSPHTLAPTSLNPDIFGSHGTFLRGGNIVPAGIQGFEKTPWRFQLLCHPSWQLANPPSKHTNTFFAQQKGGSKVAGVSRYIWVFFGSPGNNDFPFWLLCFILNSSVQSSWRSVFQTTNWWRFCVSRKKWLRVGSLGNVVQKTFMNWKNPFPVPKTWIFRPFFSKKKKTPPNFLRGSKIPSRIVLQFKHCPAYSQILCHGSRFTIPFWGIIFLFLQICFSSSRHLLSSEHLQRATTAAVFKKSFQMTWRLVPLFTFSEIHRSWGTTTCEQWSKPIRDIPWNTGWFIGILILAYWLITNPIKSLYKWPV